MPSNVLGAPSFAFTPKTNFPTHNLNFYFLFKYYVIEEVGEWGQKMAIFDDL